MTEGRPPAGDGGMTTVPRSVAKPGTPPAGFEPNFKPGSEYDHTRPRRDKPVQLTRDPLDPYNIDHDVTYYMKPDGGFWYNPFDARTIPGIFGFPEYDRRGDPYTPGGPDPMNEPHMPFHPGWNGSGPYREPLRGEDRGTKPTDGDRKPSGPPSGSR